jgi:7-cyano-7-deazaguanine synthase
MKQAVLSLSGGMDSSTLLLNLLNDGYEVTCLSFDYGQKHKVELERATELVKYINGMSWDSLHGIDLYPKVKHQIITLDGLSELLVSGLMRNDSMELKKGHYAHENALTSVVPNRNAIFASIVYAVALSKVKENGNPCKIALGTHMGDFDNNKQEGIYPDCSEEFRTALEHAFKIGNWDSDKVDYYAPYNTTDKTGVLRDGIKQCENLGLNYKEIYLRTNTSYDPIKVEYSGSTMEEMRNGGVEIEWYSDYKSGSSIERIESFIKLGLEDPLQYAEEDGTLVSWEFVKKYVEKICQKWENNKLTIQEYLNKTA